MARRARAGRERKRSAGPAIAQQPRRNVRNPYPPLAILSEDHVEAIHQGSLAVLRDTGMNFLLPEAVDIVRREGAKVDDDGVRVRFDPDMVMEKIRTAPKTFTLHARNPGNNVRIGGDSCVFATVGSTPNVSDIDRGRVSGNFADYNNLLRLTQSLNAAQIVGGYPVEPVDLNPRTRHLEAVSAATRLTDKAVYCYSLGRERVEDAIEIARIARGVDHDTLKQEPSIHTVVNANSPLVYDAPMLEGAMIMARLGQPVIFTPFTLAGAMAPITVAGALVQQNAEALAGILFSQCVNPGAPVIYGSFTSNVDMKTGSPAFGTPEYAKATIASGQLARRYGLPLRASNATASNAPDAQAAYESQMSLWSCMLGHVNYVLHALGWLEGGLCTSYEKFIIDAEMIQMMIAWMTPAEVDEAALAVNAIEGVGPASHYFQAPHTLERYETAFYAPLLSDWRNYETWQDSGSVDATRRANRIWKQLLADYEEPPMDPAIRDELDAFVAKRIEAGGAPPL